MDVAYVLINTAPQKEHYVYQSLLKYAKSKEAKPRITELQPVFGEYDLVARVEIAGFNELSNFIVDKIRTIPGIIEAKTLTGIFLTNK